MSSAVYGTTASQAPSSLGNTFSSPFYPIGPSTSFDNFAPGTMRLGDPDMSAQGLNGLARADSTGAILMRKLPRNTSRESLRSMLLFAKEFIDADFVSTDLPEDNGFLTAIARFNTVAAAEEARALLDGKPNSKNDATMVVEFWNDPVGSTLSVRRNTIDHSANRGLLGCLPSNGPLSRQSSRFNGTFQSLERLATNNQSDPMQSPPEHGPRLHALFSPQSPVGNGANGLPRVSGKSMIDQDPDEDTGELLKDPVGYAENGHSGSVSTARRSTNPQIPTGRFSNLSLATNVSSAPLQNYPPGGSTHMGVPAPSSGYSQSMNNNHLGNQGFHYSSQHNPRHSLPAANPNDLNPPCNTLYVGNLPPDTSEEELKALFSKQRGYKRLCFRNKSNGPMCFVEFDEVAMASKTLNELYGYKLSNSVKTGIRLSFSKNPLGVRSGQPGSMSASSSLASQGPVSSGGNVNGMHNPMFSTVSGPPPGLSTPPGLVMPLALRNSSGMHPSMNPHATMANSNYNPNAGLGIRANGMNPVASPPPLGGGATGTPSPAMGGFNSYYPDYMMGR